MPDIWMICVGVLLLALLLRGAAEGRPPAESDELRRMRRLSEKIRREAILPFE